MTTLSSPAEQTNGPAADPVRRSVVVATRRLRQRRTIRFGATGFLIGSLVGFVAAVAISANLLRESTLPGGGAFLFLPTLAGFLAGAFYGAAGRYNPVPVARLLERRLDLKDRLSTALSTPRDGSAVIDAQHADAAMNAPGETQVFAAVPLTPLPRRVYVAGAVALAVALAYFAPTLPVFWSSTKRTEQATVKKEGEKLLAVAKAAAAEARKQGLPEAEKAAKKVEKLGKEMTRGRMPLREALMERAKLSEELRKAQDKIAREQTNRAEQKTRENLNGAGRDAAKTMKSTGVTPATNAAANTPDGRMLALQDALARGDKSGVAQALRDMADAAERGEPAPGAQRDKTGQQLVALGDALGKNNLADAGKSAEAAGDSMSKNAMPDAAQSLREAADKIEQSAGTAGAAGAQSQQSTGQQQSQGGQSAAGGPAQEKSALQKMMDGIQKTNGEGSPQSGSSGSQSGQSSSGSPSQSGAQQGGSQQSGSQQSGTQQSGSQSQGQSGQSGSPGQGSQSQSGQSQSGQPGQGSQSQNGQPGSGNQPGQSGSSGKSGSQGGKSGNGSGSANKSGQGSGKSSGPRGGKSGNSGGGGKGSGDGSSGNAKTGDSAGRLGKGAKEQNVRGKQSGEGPETVIAENDTDRSALPVSNLPYYKEYLKERGGPASEAAQTRDAVPNAYRNQVRGYFDSLPPAPPSGAKGP